MIFTLPKSKKILTIALIMTFLAAAAIFFNGRNNEVPINSQNEASEQAADHLEKQIQQTEYSNEGAFFAEYRLQRERNRSREMRMLQEIVNSADQAQSAKETASIKIMSIMEDIEKEMKAENLIKSRGIEECVVISEPTMSTVVISGSASAIDEDEIRSIISPVLEQGKEDITMVFRD